MVDDFPKANYGNLDPEIYKWISDSWDGGNRIRSKKHGQCIDIYGANYRNDATVAFYDCHSNPNQKFV